MSEEFDRDLHHSLHDFVSTVWPFLQAKCPAFRHGGLRVVEPQRGSTLPQDFDAIAGIDAYQRSAIALRGIAFRIQWGRNYETFTIREARSNGSTTEYQKRLAVIKHRDQGYLYPYWTIQAYLNKPGGQLLSVGVARTTELYLYIEEQERTGPALRRYQTGRERFMILHWQQYQRSQQYLFTHSTKKGNKNT